MDEIGAGPLRHADEVRLHQRHPVLDHQTAGRLLPFHLLHRALDDPVFLRIDQIGQAKRIGVVAAEPAIGREQLSVVDLEEEHPQPRLADEFGIGNMRAKRIVLRRHRNGKQRHDKKQNAAKLSDHGASPTSFIATRSPDQAARRRRRPGHEGRRLSQSRSRSRTC